MAYNLIPLAAVLIISYALVKGGAHMINKKFMTKLRLKPKKMPPLGKIGLIGIAGSVMIWAGFLVYILFG
jgi:hypothetical protein